MRFPWFPGCDGSSSHIFSITSVGSPHSEHPRTEVRQQGNGFHSPLGQKIAPSTFAVRQEQIKHQVKRPLGIPSDPKGGTMWKLQL
jgi:hypothetical protein